MNEEILKAIMKNLEQVPLECQEKVLDIVKSMAFTRKCLIEEKSSLNCKIDSDDEMSKSKKE